MYVIPPEKSAEFVSNMEDVLEIYHRPYDPNCPVICMDEQPIQLVKETRLPLPAKPGQPEAELVSSDQSWKKLWRKALRK
jgi:hypothetical protein